MLYLLNQLVVIISISIIITIIIVVIIVIQTALVIIIDIVITITPLAPMISLIGVFAYLTFQIWQQDSHRSIFDLITGRGVTYRT